METNYNEELAIAIKKLCISQPFYGLFAMMLVKQWTDEIPTMGVSVGTGMNYNLQVNPDFFGALSKDEKLGVTQHEVLHIIFNHPLMWDMYPNHEIGNIAMDIEVNQYIDNNILPQGGCFLKNFPELDNKPRMGAKWYYDELMKNLNNPNSTIGQLNQSGQLGTGAKIVVKIGKGKGQGNNGGESGDMEVEITDPNHQWDKTMGELDDISKELIKAQMEHIVKEVAASVKSRGTLPGEIEEILKRLNEIKKSKFNWRAYIRRFAGNSTKSYIKGTRRKENKRIPGQPTVKVKFTQKLLIAVDTSGSVSTNELKEFLNEMTYLTKLGHEIDVIECDTNAHDVFKFNPRSDFSVYGRGGTSFQPPIDYYNEHMKQYSCLIYCTDGECCPPQNAHGNILWVLSQQSNMNNDLPGQVIKIEF